MQKLNPKEQAILDHIRSVTAERGYAPSVREIGIALEYKSTSTVQMYLDRLESYGYIQRECGKSRSIRLKQESAVRRLPMLCDSESVTQDYAEDICLCGARWQNRSVVAVPIASAYGDIPAGSLVLVELNVTRDAKPVAYRTSQGIVLAESDQLVDGALIGCVIAIWKLL